ncbi:hypothetical protein [Cryptosporangium arvum]|uniref:Condensation domain-containing protein n=1 Tax=Cryptosporangium arvum DSM 44712 TaxID=927661 RepID=A0A010ZY36_9ACTN|nr:hypothetical protein [Cryptosporangium arvum]EXG82127.1 hypothetical protein CryarDRAFT_3269 [Cryptosporangium arvum DSM 44712]
MRPVAGKPYSRKMSLAERVQLANPPGIHTYIQLFVEGTGTLDPRALSAAVAAASDACPGARLTRRGRRWVDSTTPPAVRVHDGDTLDRYTFDGLDTMFRPLSGQCGAPTCEVVQLTGARPGLVFRVHHAAMDGMGLLLWAGEVFRALRGEEPQPAVSDLTMSDVLRAHGPGERPPPPRMTSAPPLRARATLERRGTFFLRRTLPTPHWASVPKIAVALTRLCALGTGYFTIPIDLRRHVPDVRSTANLSGAVLVSAAEDATWLQVYRQLQRALTANQDLWTLGGPRLMDAFGRLPMGVLRPMVRTADGLLARGGVPQPAFALAHFGLLDLAAYSGGGFAASTAYVLPTCGLNVMPVLTIVETAKRTELVLCGDDGPGMAGLGGRLLDGIKTSLAALPA